MKKFKQLTNSVVTLSAVISGVGAIIQYQMIKHITELFTNHGMLLTFIGAVTYFVVNCIIILIKELKSNHNSIRELSEQIAAKEDDLFRQIKTLNEHTAASERAMDRRIKTLNEQFTHKLESLKHELSNQTP